MNLPNKKYDVIYADPAWKYNNKSPPCLPKKQPETCKIEYYYPTMEIKDIKKMSIKEISKDNCVLFLWTTTPVLPEAIEVMKKWGFKYKTMITWEKTNNDCMGYWFRVCTEHLLVGVKGKVKAFRNMNRTCYSEKRTKHSKKPEHFYKLIEETIQGEKIELFARNRRKGWDSWGNELEENITKVICSDCQKSFLLDKIGIINNRMFCNECHIKRIKRTVTEDKP